MLQLQLARLIRESNSKYFSIATTVVSNFASSIATLAVARLQLAQLQAAAVRAGRPSELRDGTVTVSDRLPVARPIVCLAAPPSDAGCGRETAHPIDSQCPLSCASAVRSVRAALPTVRWTSERWQMSGEPSPVSKDEGGRRTDPMTAVGRFHIRPNGRESSPFDAKAVSCDHGCARPVCCLVSPSRRPSRLRSASCEEAARRCPR